MPQMAGGAQHIRGLAGSRKQSSRLGRKHGEGSRKPTSRSAREHETVSKKKRSRLGRGRGLECPLGSCGTNLCLPKGFASSDLDDY